MALPCPPFPCISTAWHSIWSLVQHNHSHQSGWHLEVTDKHRCSLTAEHLGKERGISGTCWVYPTCAVLFECCCAIWLGHTGNPKGKWKLWVHFVLEPLLLYQPTRCRVNPSWWARCDWRGSDGLCTHWPSVLFTIPTGWISCPCGAWHGISRAQTWEPRHMLGGRVTGLWLWNSPIWSTAVSVLERSDLNFTQYYSDVWPAHPSLLEIPHVFLNCTCLPLLPLFKGLY